MTLTTVGYGDISAKNTQQRYLGIMAMIGGAVYFAYGVTHIVNIVEELNRDGTRFSQKLDKYNQYMNFRSLSKELRSDAREFLIMINHRKQSEESSKVFHLSCTRVVVSHYCLLTCHPAWPQLEGDLLRDFSRGLRTRVASEVYKKIVVGNTGCVFEVLADLRPSQPLPNPLIFSHSQPCSVICLFLRAWMSTLCESTTRERARIHVPVHPHTCLHTCLYTCLHTCLHTCE